MPPVVKMELAMVKIILVFRWAKGIRNNPKLARIAGEVEQYYRQMTTERDPEAPELKEDVTWGEHKKKRTGIAKRSRRPSDRLREGARASCVTNSRGRKSKKEVPKKEGPGRETKTDVVSQVRGPPRGIEGQV